MNTPYYAHKKSALQLEPEPEVMLDINTTPLIDVMLVLLIMFIITIPIQLHSVKLDLPRAVHAQSTIAPTVVKIHVDAENRIQWNGETVDMPAFKQRCMDAAGLEDQPEIHVHAERSTRYEVVAKVMSAAQKSGLRKIGFTDTYLFK